MTSILEEKQEMNEMTALMQLAENPEMAALAINTLFPIISKKLPAVNKNYEVKPVPGSGKPIPIFRTNDKRSHPSTKIWKKIKDTKDEILGIHATEICKEMDRIHQSINLVDSNETALQLASQIIDDVKEHKTKEVKAYVTPIKLKDYYLTIPFRKEYIASILPEESSNISSKIDKDLHITVKYDLTMSDLINLLGKKRNIQIYGTYDAIHTSENNFGVQEGEYRGLLVSVDGITDRPPQEAGDGAYHMTVESPTGFASALGTLCKTDINNIIKFQSDNIVKFYGYVCLMKKRGGNDPVHIGLDIDNTTFGVKDGCHKPLLNNGTFDFKTFNTPKWTMENYTGKPLLQILNQLSPEYIHFITNRRCQQDPETMRACFNKLATTFLGRPTNFPISFEPERIDGKTENQRCIGKANSKQLRLLKATSGDYGVLFDDECVPYLSSPKVIGVDVLQDQKVRLVESIKKTFAISCQGCVASGKSTMWNNVIKILEGRGVSVKYLAADQLLEIGGGCYRYVEGIIPTLQCDVLIFDTTCASGKPDFVDKMFQQEITDPDGYICLCFERLIKRIGHPTLNSPVADFLGVAAISNDFIDMPLFQLLQKIYHEKGGYDGMTSWFAKRGFTFRERTYGSIQTAIVTYLEYSQVWTKWGRQARGFKILLGPNKEPIHVACEQLQRGTELVTSNTANVEGDVENYKYQQHFAKEQQALLKTLRSSDGSTPLKLLSVGKDDGMLCSVVLVPKTDKCYQSYVEIMNNDHTGFAQKLLAICEELPFIIVFQSQKTMITGDMVNVGIVTSFQQIFYPNMSLDKDKPPKDYIEDVIMPFLSTIKAFFSIVKTRLQGKAVLMFECCNKGSKDYQGRFHWELTANGPQSRGSFRLLGINFEDNHDSWQYIPSATIADNLRQIFLPLDMPAGFVTNTVGELNQIISSLTQCIRGEITMDEYVAISSQFCTFGQPETISPEGFVVFEIGEDYNGFGLLGKNYNKVKVAEYYICHKWEKYLPDILSLSDSVANSVSQYFGTVYFVRKLFQTLPDKLNLVLEEGKKYLCPSGEYYIETREKLQPKAVTALLELEDAESTGQKSKKKRKKRNKKQKNLYQVFVQNIETRTPEKIRGFLCNNDGPRQFIYGNLKQFCIRTFGLQVENPNDYEDILIGLCHRLLEEDASDVSKRIETVKLILQKKGKHVEDYNAFRIARLVQNLYPYFKRSDDEK